MQNVTFITGNPHKAAYLAKWLGLPVGHRKLDLDEIQSLDLKEVVTHKARQAYELIGQPVIVEDAALAFTGMGRLPGTFIKWFVEELGNDGLIKLADSLPNRQATGTLMYAYCDGDRLELFEGVMKGSIARAPQGSDGFGFDPIFINDGYNVTRAEMDEETYAATSYRAEALQKLKAFLQPA